MKIYRPFVVLLLFTLIVGLACNFGAPSDTKATEPPTTGDPTSPPEEPTKSTGSSSNSVNNLDKVRTATIQIESQGTFVDPQVGLVVNGAGRGSGFIIDPSGIAITNNHVVTGAALIKVWVGGETTPRNAKILGVSECSDLAVIDIDGDGYPYMDWYSGNISPGLEVYSAGYPLGEPEFTLTKGIISKERADGKSSWASLDYAIMHDSTINPGNSGGPLVTADGKVVGVNYMSRPDANQYFAIDTKLAIPVIEKLQQSQDIESIGINGSAVSNDDGSLTGIWISSVKSGSPADAAGLQGGDILYQLEGLVLGTDGTMKDYCDILRSHKASDTLSVSVIRFASGELLEGQLNGRSLEVTGNFDTGGGSGGNSGGSSSGGEAADFFTEDFNEGVDLSNYSFFEYHGNDDDVNLNADGGFLVFDLQKANLWTYVTYDPYIYTDVALEMKVENRGKNNNNVSLICRYSDEGWYEFNIANNGLYWIYAYTISDNAYNRIYNGGSNAIKTGRGTNTYTAYCNGSTLSLYINGVEARTVEDTKYNLPEGKVGLGVSSFDVLPILIGVDYFTVAQP